MDFLRKDSSISMSLSQEEARLFEKFGPPSPPPMDEEDPDEKEEENNEIVLEDPKTYGMNSEAEINQLREYFLPKPTGYQRDSRDRENKVWKYSGIQTWRPYNFEFFKQFFELYTRHLRFHLLKEPIQEPEFPENFPNFETFEEKEILEEINNFLICSISGKNSYHMILRNSENSMNVLEANKEGKMLEIFSPYQMPSLIDRKTYQTDTDQISIKNKKRKRGKDPVRNPILKTKNVFAIWRNWPNRKTVNQIVFKPNIRPGFVDFENSPILNLWSGFPFYDKNYISYLEPEKVTVSLNILSILKEHIFHVICNSNREIYDYFVKWMAYIRQNPGERADVIIFVCGDQGSGKTLLAETFISLFGDAGLYLHSQTDLYNQYGGPLMDNKIIVGCDEVDFRDKTSMDKFKSMITSKERRTEKKYGDIKQVRNHLNYFCTANRENVVPVEPGNNRRIFQFTCSTLTQGNKYYFDRFHSQFTKGENRDLGMRVFDHWLSTMDLRNFNVKFPPLTETLLAQIILSLPPLQKWWYEVLNQKMHIPPNKYDPSHKIDPLEENWLIFPVSMNRLREIFCEFSSIYSKKANPMAPANFRNLFSRIVPESAKLNERGEFTMPTFVKCKEWMDSLGGKGKVPINTHEIDKNTIPSNIQFEVDIRRNLLKPNGRFLIPKRGSMKKSIDKYFEHPQDVDKENRNCFQLSKNEYTSYDFPPPTEFEIKNLN